MTESDRRMTGTNGATAVRVPVRAANTRQRPIYDRINRDALREQIRRTRAKSELVFRQTREIIARTRALLIEPI